MAAEWNDSMATGVDSLDNQHKEMFLMVAKLKEAIDQDKNRAEIGRILDALARFAMRHFAEEELWMEKQHCPSAEANKQSHDGLLEKFDVFRERYAEHGAKNTMVVNFHDTLSRWMMKHVTDVKTQLSECAASPESPALASTC
jgi:hemerythrin